MKKKILFALLISSISLSGCNTSNTTISSSVVEPDAKPLETSESTPSKNESSISELSLDIDWTTAEELVKSTLLEIGVNDTDILSMNVENVDDSSVQTDATFLIQTDVMELEADITYYKALNKWDIIWILNSKNQHIYYLNSNLAGTMDLYQYPSDELLSPATSNLKQNSEELETIWESVEEKNNAALSSITENME